MKKSFAYLLISVLILSTLPFQIPIVGAGTPPFTISEHTDYSLTQNTIYINITENLGKAQTINVSSIFPDNYLTEQINYQDFQELQDANEDVYGLVNNTYQIKSSNTSGNGTVSYYDRSGNLLNCNYISADGKTCYIPSQQVTGTKVVQKFLPVPILNQKTVVSGLKVENKNGGIVLPKNGMIQLKYTYSHPLAIPQNQPTPMENEYNISVSSMDGTDNTVLDPTWWNSSWNYYKNISLTEGNFENRTLEPIELNITGLTLLTNNCSKEIRIVDNNQNEINNQITDDGGQALSAGSQWCKVLFLANATQNAITNYSVYYGNSNAIFPSYTKINFNQTSCPLTFNSGYFNGNMGVAMGLITNLTSTGGISVLMSIEGAFSTTQGAYTSCSVIENGNVRSKINVSEANYWAVLTLYQGAQKVYFNTTYTSAAFYNSLDLSSSQTNYGMTSECDNESNSITCGTTSQRAVSERWHNTNNSNAVIYTGWNNLNAFYTSSGRWVWFYDGALQGNASSSLYFGVSNQTTGWNYAQKEYYGYLNPLISSLGSEQSQNTAPTLVSNSTSPSTVYKNTNYTVNITGTDAENYYLNAYTQFYKNGAPLGALQYFNLTNNTNSQIALLRVGNFSKGDTLLANVILGDGTINNTAFNTSSSVVQNTAPSVLASATSPSTVYINSNWTLNLTAKDIDSDTITAYVQFWVNNVTNGSLQSKVISDSVNSIAGVLGSGNFSLYDNLTAQYWLGDGTVNISKVNLTAQVQNSPPTITTPQTSVTQYTNGTYLFDYNATDLEGATLIWYVNDSIFSMNSSTGVLTNTPNETIAGNRTVLVSVSDGIVNSTNTFTYQIIDATAPRITTNPVDGYIYGKTQFADVLPINLTYQITEANPKTTAYQINYPNGTMMVQNASSGYFNDTISLNLSVYGIYTWILNSTDVQGNVNQLTNHFTLNFVSGPGGANAYNTLANQSTNDSLLTTAALISGNTGTNIDQKTLMIALGIVFLLIVAFSQKGGK